MLIEEFGKQYNSDAIITTIAVPKDTPLGAIAIQIQEMIHCYASDGMLFFQKGDWVNAIASFTYGYGWLDSGIFLGYLTGQDLKKIPKIDLENGSNLADHLHEKTHRYFHMLTKAIECTTPSPDSETAMYQASLHIFNKVQIYLKSGEELINDGDELNALAVLSYGYGWLDCGVRAGIINIHGDRHLFTI